MPWNERDTEDVTTIFPDECYACAGTLTPHEDCYAYSDGTSMTFICCDCVEALMCADDLEDTGPECPYCHQRDHVRVADSTVGTVWACSICVLELMSEASWIDAVNERVIRSA